MDIHEKVKVFEASCKKLLMSDVAELNKNINQEIEKQITDELQEYQQKEELAYNKKLEKLEKDYNKQIYSLEMDSKREILNQKKLIEKELKSEVKQILKDFTNTPEYEEFLFHKIDEVLQKVQNKENSILSIVNKDIPYFADKIKEKYNISVKNIDDKYIGGCILEDVVQGIYIDNTIENSICENLINNN